MTTVLATSKVVVLGPDRNSRVVVVRDTDRLVVQAPGPAGPRGPAGQDGAAGNASNVAHVHSQSTLSTVWLVQHDLGYDPAGIDVRTDADPEHRWHLRANYLVPGRTYQLTFPNDVPGQTGTVRSS